MICTSFMKHFLGWAVPAALCSIIAFLGYRPSNSSCGASEQSVRAVMYVMFLCPVVLAIITMVSFFCRASREVKRSLIRRYGRFTPLERATVENLQVKFAIISLAFCVGWVPNVLNGIFINVLDERSSDVILVFLVLEAVLNPFQAVIDSMVMFGWPPAGCCGIFRSNHYGNSHHSNINDLQVSGRSEAVPDETDPLLSFSHNRQRQH
ncbi:G-protein coupled receptor 143-like [Mya arenaria]|uniref:G-protein coupled receptor 143-like n=1 Tax=Mya arenaria TaxID=6604 RepID=UPI0022E18CC0|nr:G-protein coupled receptor 143-like [Mya arenaria]